MASQVHAFTPFLASGMFPKVRIRPSLACKAGSGEGESGSSLRVGFITDIQYADKPDRVVDLNRTYRLV